KKIGETADSKYVIDSKLTKRVAEQFREEPDDILYVVMKFRRGTSVQKMSTNQKRLADQLNKAKIDSDRTRFIVGENGNRQTIFWLVPPGTEPPSVEN
ncbi:MAG TPA: hypothetical protein VHQ01_11995, partial [Pyrinomonadaceae bacterium]|nr:hypothetical protein [Pyrinomonadaceae bacterium]